MFLNSKKLVGLLLVFGTLFFVSALWYAESIYPKYDIFQNYISDLGIGNVAFIFNNAIMVFGLGIFVSAFLIFKIFKSRIFSILLAFSGIGAFGVGFFPENAGYLHSVFSAITFLCSAFSAIYSSKFISKPFSSFFVQLGILSLIATLLFATENTFGLGIGGMERLIVYPVLIWAFAFGIYLMVSKDAFREGSEK